MLEDFTDRLSSLIRRVLPARRDVIKQESLQLIVVPDCVRSLREIVNATNPQLAEVPFLGVIDGGIVSKIYKPEVFSQKSGLYTHNHMLHTSPVDKEQLLTLFEQVQTDDNLEKPLILGHLHPSGSISAGPKRYIIQPSDSLLEPSMGYPIPIEGGDLAFYKSFIECNPQLDVPYAAIVANTQKGLMLRVYSIKALLRQRRYNIDRIPNQTFQL